MIGSGKIKDEKKRTAVLKMIDSLNAQIETMDHLLSDRTEKKEALGKPVAPASPVKSKSKKKKMSTDEMREFAINEIHKFYSRQHQKRDVGFDEQDKW